MKRLMLYSVIGVIFTLGALFYVDRVLLDENAQITIESANLVKVKGVDSKVTKDASLFEYCEYNKTVVYANGRSVIFKTLTGNIIKDRIETDAPIVGIKVVEGRNIVLYFTFSGFNLNLYTYNIDKKESVFQKSLHIPSFYSIKDIRYSELTNMIYISCKQTGDTDDRYVLHKINIMKHSEIALQNTLIRNISLLRSKDIFVYEDADSYVYLDGQKFSYKGIEHFTLLGIDKQDNLYLLTFDNPRTILVVNDGIVKNELGIDKVDYNSLICNTHGLFLIFDDYFVDVIRNRKVNIGNYNSLIFTDGDSVIFLDKKFNIKHRKI